MERTGKDGPRGNEHREYRPCILPLIGVAAVGAIALALAAPGAALAQGSVPVAQATGSAQPKVVERTDDAEFTITCDKPSTSAKLTAPWLGVPDNTPMLLVTSTIFQFDMIIPDSVVPGKRPVHMVCSDGSSADATIIVSSSHS